VAKFFGLTILVIFPCIMHKRQPDFAETTKYGIVETWIIASAMRGFSIASPYPIAGFLPARRDRMPNVSISEDEPFRRRTVSGRSISAAAQEPSLLRFGLKAGTWKASMWLKK